MKKVRITKILISTLILLLVLICNNVNINAEETITEVKSGKTYQIDLNQDGKKENVRLTQHLLEKDNPYNYYGSIYVDGVKVYTTPKDVYGFTVTMKFVTCGNQVFLNVTQYTDNDIMLYNKLLYFNDNKLIEAIDFTKIEGVRSCEIISASEDKIKVACENMPSQLASILWNATYTVEGSKVKLKSPVHKVKSGVNIALSSLTTNRTVTFTRKVGGKKEAFKVSYGKKVKLLSITVKGNKIYGYFQYGKKKGYLRVDPYYEKSYFKGVYKYLAG